MPLFYFKGYASKRKWKRQTREDSIRDYLPDDHHGHAAWYDSRLDFVSFQPAFHCRIYCCSYWSLVLLSFQV